MSSFAGASEAKNTNSRGSLDRGTLEHCAESQNPEIPIDITYWAERYLSSKLPSEFMKMERPGNVDASGVKSPPEYAAKVSNSIDSVRSSMDNDFGSDSGSRVGFNVSDSHFHQDQLIGDTNNKIATEGPMDQLRPTGGCDADTILSPRSKIRDVVKKAICKPVYQEEHEQYRQSRKRKYSSSSDFDSDADYESSTDSDPFTDEREMEKKGERHNVGEEELDYTKEMSDDDDFQPMVHRFTDEELVHIEQRICERNDYLKRMKWLKASQVLLTVVMLGFLAFSPDVRKTIVQMKTSGLSLKVFAEALTYGTYVWFTGSFVNGTYFMMFLQRIFLYLMKDDVVDQVHFREIDAMKDTKKFLESNWNWSSLTIASTIPIFIVTIIAGCVVLFRIMKVSTNRFRTKIITSCMLCTMFTSFLLTSSLTKSIMTKESHYNLCELWAIVSLVVDYGTLLYLLYQSLRDLVGSPRNESVFTVDTAVQVFAMSFSIYLGVHFIPAIHPGFSFPATYRKVPTVLWNVFLPKVAQKALCESWHSLVVTPFMNQFFPAPPVPVVESVLSALMNGIKNIYV